MTPNTALLFLHLDGSFTNLVVVIIYFVILVTCVGKSRGSVKETTNNKADISSTQALLCSKCKMLICNNCELLKVTLLCLDSSTVPRESPFSVDFLLFMIMYILIPNVGVIGASFKIMLSTHTPT